MYLASSQDVRRQQKTPQGAFGREEAVKPQGTDQGPSAPSAQTETTSRGTGTETLLEQMLERHNMLAALKRDGMETKALRQYIRENWERIRSELLAGTYKPMPVRRVEIPKPDGSGFRLLGNPACLDRLLQQALMQVLTPIFDPHFSECSFGFRQGRSAHDAVRVAQRYMKAGFTWVVDMDLAQFFDRVDHDILMARVARKVEDKRVLLLIRRYLEAGVMIGGLKVRTEEGTPQGGPLSPLLANILLDDLDKELEKRGHRFARYADDNNIYVKSKQAGERVFQRVKHFLENCLKLKVNEAKSAVDRPWKRKFLGFSFYNSKNGPRVRLAPKTVERLQKKLRDLTKRSRSLSMTERIRQLNSYLGGWMGYFALADAKELLKGKDEWLRRRLRQILWKAWKRPQTRRRELRRLGLAEQVAREIAGTRKGYWRTAATPQLHKALGLAYWRDQGLVGLLERYERSRRAWRTAVCDKTHVRWCESL